MSILDYGFSLFVTPVALAISLVYFYGLMTRAITGVFWQSVAVGIMLGSASVYALYHPFELADGFIIDLRNLFIGLAAGLFGLVAGLVALAIGATTRLAIGGSGAMLGVLGMSTAVGFALLWRYLYKPPSRHKRPALLALGAMISGHLLAVMLAPPDMRYAFFMNAAPPILIANIAGTYLIGRLLHRERILLAEEERLHVAARTDPLTNLLNRRSAKAAFAECDPTDPHDEGRAIAYLDIDNFKPINDANGHGVGDAVLLEVSKRIQASLRPQDILARIGGDEFLIILPDISEEDAARVSERCRISIDERPFVINGATLDITISVGVKWHAGGSSFETQVAQADASLYVAKARGRNCVALAEQDAFVGQKRPSAIRMEATA